MRVDGGLILAAPHWAGLADAVRAAWPREACGLVLGEPAQGRPFRRATRYRMARNLATEPHHQFVLDPHDLLAAAREGHARGEEILAVWHSHPCPATPTARDACPSTRDGQDAWSGWLHLIGAVGPIGEPLWRCWQLAAGSWLAYPLRGARLEGDPS